MLVVVSYDVSTSAREGERRLRRVAKACENYGIRVQNSVFECLLEPGQWVTLKTELLKTISLKEDSLRFYYLGKNWQTRVEHHGAKQTPNMQDDILLL